MGLPQNVAGASLTIAVVLYLILYAIVLSWVWREENKISYEQWICEDDHMTSFRCSFCHEHIALVMDFGWTALAGGFLKPEQFENESKYPTRLCFCPSCYAVQLVDRVTPDKMFKHYFYFSSATETIKRHFREYAKEVVSRFNPKTAIEIGCNDGVLIGPLRDMGVKVTGVDPSSTVPKGPDIINDYFTKDVAKRIGKVDMVIANNVFAHINDIRGATDAVVEALNPDGVFILEVHYLGDMLDKLQYDWIYHEHIYYYSLLALENHFKNYGLSVFDVKPVNTHGGSMRYYVSRNRPESEAVTKLRNKEMERGLDKLETFLDFAKRVDRHRSELRESLSGKKVVGYGASGRANALIQYCDLQVDYIVDDAPAKHGFYTPGSHVPIYSREKLEQDPPEGVVVFAWGYLDEIRKKCDLPMILPLPDIRTIENRKVA